MRPSAAQDMAAWNRLAQHAQPAPQRAARRQSNGKAQQPTQAEAAAEEIAYNDLRNRGLSYEAAKAKLGLSHPKAERLHQWWVAQTSTRSTDGSVPKFADHERHIREVMKLGGFCWLSERRLAGGKVVACPPVHKPVDGVVDRLLTPVPSTPWVR